MKRRYPKSFIEELKKAILTEIVRTKNYRNSAIDSDREKGRLVCAFQTEKRDSADMPEATLGANVGIIYFANARKRACNAVYLGV